MRRTAEEEDAGLGWTEACRCGLFEGTRHRGGKLTCREPGGKPVGPEPCWGYLDELQSRRLAMRLLALLAGVGLTSAQAGGHDVGAKVYAGIAAAEVEVSSVAKSV
eukprot:COSAG02_NODE_1095_length_14602_cov_33.808867_3_plen_106_part_00